MDFLHMKTVLFSYTLTQTVCALVVWALWRADRQRYAGVNFWLAHYVLSVVFVFLILLRGVVPDLLSIVLANALGMSGLILLREGLGRFLGKRGAAPHDWALLAVFIAAHYFFTFNQPSLSARNINLNAFVLFFSLECAWTLLKGTAPQLRHAAKPPALALAAIAALSAVRIFTELRAPVGPDFMTVTGVHALLVLLYTVLTIGLTFGLFLMLNRRLLTETTADFQKRVAAEELLAGALKVAKLGTWTWDIKRGVLDWSDQMYVIFGIDRASFTGDLPAVVAKAIHPDDRAAVDASNSAVASEGKASPLEYRVVHPDGAERWIYAEASELVKDADGKPVLLRGFAQDVTARKQSEERVRASEERFQKAFRAAPVLMSLSEVVTGRYLEVNDKFCEVSGFRREELIGKTSTEIGWITKEVRDRLIKESNGCSARIPELSLRAKDGRTVICSYACELVRLGNQDLLLSIAEDITERRQAEQALRESEARFREVVENAPDAIFVQSGGKFAYLNPACGRMFGADPAERLVGADMLDLVAPESRSLVSGRMREQAAPYSTPATLHVRYQGPGGIQIDAESTAVPVKFAGKDSQLVFVRDVGERKRAEEARFRAQKLESVGVLAGGIAHDFNNLLTGIVGNISMIKAAAPGGELAEMIAEAETACLTAKGLARQLLTFSSGGEPVKEHLELGELVKEATAFSLRGSGAGKSVEVPDSPLVVDADKEQLFQVIQNLVLNAVQAMPGGGTVRIRASELELGSGRPPALPAGRYASVEVKDSGAGIPRDMMPRLFDPYFSTKGKGRGLGLSVCNSIVLKHGGHISAASEQGKGSVFTVLLPLAAGQARAKAAQAPGKTAAAGGRVLIMDDEEIVYKALRRMVTSLGYEAEIAVNGEEALLAWEKAMREGRPFLAAVMDLTISGGMGGVEAVKKLLELDPAAKAVVSSGYSDDPAMANYKAHGFCGVLKKPYQFDDVGAVLAVLAGRG